MCIYILNLTYLLGNYVYLKTAPPRKENDKAVIVSHTYPRTTGKGVCFNFWYHLMGKDIGTINIYIIQKYQTKRLKLWTRSGDQGKIWKHGRVTIITKGYWRNTYNVRAFFILLVVIPW